jgi:hypothetical protein
MTDFEGQRGDTSRQHHALGSQICTSNRRRRICGRIALCAYAFYMTSHGRIGNGALFLVLCPLPWCYGARQCWRSWRTRRVVHHKRCQCSFLRGAGCRAGGLPKANLSYYPCKRTGCTRVLFTWKVAPMFGTSSRITGRSSTIGLAKSCRQSVVNVDNGRC